MEQLIDAIRALTHRRAAEVRLTIFIVLGALKSMLPEAERGELAAALPMELGVLLLGGGSSEDEEAFDDLALVDMRTVELVCRLLAADASPATQSLVLRYVVPRLCGHPLGSRSSLESTGFDAFGPTTMRARDRISMEPS